MTMDEQMPKCPSDYLRMVEDEDDWVGLQNWVELVLSIAAAAGVLTALLMVWLPLPLAAAIAILGSAVLNGALETLVARLSETPSKQLAAIHAANADLKALSDAYHEALPMLTHEDAREARNAFVAAYRELQGREPSSTTAVSRHLEDAARGLALEGPVAAVGSDGTTTIANTANTSDPNYIGREQS